jgi:L-rhamnose mutarotase
MADQKAKADAEFKSKALAAQKKLAEYKAKSGQVNKEMLNSLKKAGVAN